MRPPPRVVILERVMAYAAPGVAKDAPVVATGRVSGHTRVLARGRLRHNKLTLSFTHLKRGRYRRTLVEQLGHGRTMVIGRTTLGIT
jgi:hypothetical protein